MRQNLRRNSSDHRGSARLRAQGGAGAPGAPIDPHEWLVALVERTQLHDDEAAHLISLAADFEPSAREAIFVDGPLAIVLCAAEDCVDAGEALLAGFEYVRAMADHDDLLPGAPEHFGFIIDRRKFADDEGIFAPGP